MNANESNHSRNEYAANNSECNESVENDVKGEESQFYESDDSNQQFDDMHNVDSSFYYDEYKEEEKCNNSNSLSSSDECECVTIPVVEVLSKEEDLCDS